MINRAPPWDYKWFGHDKNVHQATGVWPELANETGTAAL